MSYTPAQFLQMALDAGFSQAQALVITGTAAAESSLGQNLGPSPGGAVGVLQFEPITFGQYADSSCGDINNSQCQLKAAKNLTDQQGFQKGWFDNWFVNWNASAVGRFNDAVSALGGNVILPADQSNVLGGGGAPAQPAGISIPGLSGIDLNPSHWVAGLLPYMVLIPLFLLAGILLLRDFSRRASGAPAE